MCSSCDCKCKVSLEVGKTYVSQMGGHVEILTRLKDTYVGRLVKARPGNLVAAVSTKMSKSGWWNKPVC